MLETTKVSLGKRLFVESLEKYKQDNLSRLDEFYFETSDVSANPVKLLKRIEDLYSLYESLNSYDVPAYIYDVGKDIQDLYAKETNSYSEKFSSFKIPYLQKIASIKKHKEEQVKELEHRIEEYKADKTLELKDSLKNYYKLQDKKEDIEKYVKTFNLDCNAFESSIDTRDLTNIEKTCKTALEALDVIERNPKAVHKIVELAYFPLVYKGKDKSQDLIFRLSWTVALALLCYIGKPFFLSFIAIFYFIDLVSNLIGIRDKKKIIEMCNSLICEIPLEEFVEDSEDYYDLEFQLDEAKELDIETSIKEIEDKIKAEESDILQLDPSDNFNKDMSEWVTYMQSNDFHMEIKRVYNNLVSRKEYKLESIQAQINLMEEYKKVYIDNVKMLGESIPMEEYISPKIKIGEIHDESGTILMQQNIEIGINNIIFKYDDDDSQYERIDFMKLLLSNYICNIREKHLAIHIFDSEFLGKDLTEFTSNEELSKYMTIHTDKLKDKITSISSDILARNKKLKNKTLHEYNKECQSIGKITMDYELIIIMSSKEKFTDDKAFRKLLDYSADKGYIFWIFQNTTRPKKEGDDFEEQMKFFKGLPYCDEYGKLYDEYSDSLIDLDNDVSVIEYTPELGYTVADTFEKLVKDKNRNSSALPYEEKFRVINIPDDKIWTYCTNKGVDLMFGLQEGDPEKPFPYTLDNGNVHMLMAGQTGAGKSATINQFLANLLHMYSPEELELIMIDFKNIEFKMYTGEYAIPHTSVIAGTKDGEYALSIFDYLISVLEARTAQYGTRSLNNIELWNNLMRAEGHPELCHQRIVVLIDEFQTMFTEVDPKSVEKIKAKITSITRLARFCGMHLVFTSQGMKGTMSKDILDNFSLRAALRCTSDVSNDLLGNDASSKIKERFGWMNVNDSTGQDPTANKLYRIPFISVDEIHTYIKKLRQKCKDEGHIDRKAEYYDEDRVHSSEELNTRCSDETFMHNKYAFVLGERTAFSTSKKPDNFLFDKSYDENLVMNCFERKEMCNMILTYLTQMKDKGVPVIVHCPDEELVDVLGLKDLVEEKYHKYLSEDFLYEDLITDLTGAMEYLTTYPEAQQPRYFIGINWDNFSGVGVNTDKYIQRLTDLMHILPKLDYHFLLFTSNTKPLKYNIDLFKHRACTFCDEAQSMATVKDSSGTKLKEGFAVYKYGKETYKHKIYNFTLKREFRERTLK